MNPQQSFHLKHWEFAPQQRGLLVRMPSHSGRENPGVRGKSFSVMLSAAKDWLFFVRGKQKQIVRPHRTWAQDDIATFFSSLAGIRGAWRTAVRRQTSTAAWRITALRLILLVSLCLMLMPLPARSAESEDVADAPIGWLFRWLNFALVFGAGGYFVVTRTRPAFRARADKIASTVEEKARLRDEAQARLREAEAKLAGIDQEAEKLRAIARQEALAEAERIRALAQEEIAKIERAAQGEIEASERAARNELKAFAARLVIERAEGVLREMMTPQADEAIFRFFVSGLSGSVN